jgi:beta-glucosidase/6-phospho-beta-glucosidase/beta-galactosidase
VSNGFVLPDGFRFGVATAGFQVEGGYNGPGRPANNWAEWEARGRVEPSGMALDFWNDYEHQLDRAVAAGCDAFRLSVEWARCQPNPHETDDDAVAHYARILAACLERGLQPLVTLHHFTHPAWLGVDFWLGLDAPDRFAEWVSTVVPAFAPHCSSWVTINEINVYAMQSYFNGLFPPGRRVDSRAMVRCLDHLLAAHVLAYEAIHRVQPQAIVATNTYSMSAYEGDRLFIDALLARSHGIDRHDVHDWLVGRKQAFERALPGHGPAEAAVRRLAASLIPLDQALPRALSAVFASPYERTLDVAQIDFYDPRVDRKYRIPGHTTAGGRNWIPGRLLWDDPPDPAAFARYCHVNHEHGLDVWIAENGLCNRVRRGAALGRLDGWDRVRYLRAYLGALADAIIAGVPIGAYYHWCLADNYEWGSYEPRFGLYGIDRTHGIRWRDVDSMGGRAAETYAKIAAGLRAGDLSVVERLARSS